MIKDQRLKMNNGFTIVESLVAITILVLVITGAAGAIQSAISSYIFSKDQIIAFYLAQEGFEQIRNIRDENGLRDLDWLTGISANSGDPCFFGEACLVDPIDAGGVFVERCIDGDCPVLRQDPTTGFFGYDPDPAWSDTVFNRKIVLTQINSNEVAITVTVDWSKGLTSRQFKATENILDWQ
jgi:prepilin-type N-terminal cleavage/methylation domain-containing protein